MALDTKNHGNIKKGNHIEEKDNYNALCVGIGGTGVIRASMILGWAALQEGFKVRTAETHGMSQRGGSVSSYLRFGKTLENPFMIEGDLDVLLAFEISEALRNLNFVNKDTLIIASTNSVIPPSVLTYQTLNIDMNKCVGCGNCLAHCVPNEVFLESRYKNSYTLIKGPTRRVINGYTRVLQSCTGCSQCIIDKVCPFDAIEAYNEFEYPEISAITKDIQSVAQDVLILDANEIAINAGNILAANVVLIGTLAGMNRIPLSENVLKETVKQFVPKKAIDVNMRAFERGFQEGVNFRQNL
ncbi:MAG: putative Indolepyruvate ferredoxin oxidoreductase [Promethearchaeota archaeon]|nr:MAG: putative Indolepyruvate ferredoxin oxidoreductase [Candidatus Lokiarchaeota archaeon]